MDDSDCDGRACARRAVRAHGLSGFGHAGQSSNANTISGTYKVSAGDLATNGSDTDVAQNVANDIYLYI